MTVSKQRANWKCLAVAGLGVTGALLAGSLGAGLLGAGSLGASASAAPANYVALGDSYTSGPLITPSAPGAPAACLQSSANYPHLVAAADGLHLTDRSCSGARAADMTTAQHSNQPAQFDALNAATDVVTIGIGGNDHGLFLGAVVTCSAIDALDPFGVGSPCRSAEASTYSNGVAADAATLGSAFARIHVLAPNARVFVVGYPDILPQSGSCYSKIPLTSGDVSYLNGIETELNTTLQRQAAAHGATYVDTYTPSIGHDLCQASGTRWIEPPIPGADAAPLHPDAAGEAADARAVEAAFSAAGLG
jgi:hypothetical protein